MRNKRNIAILSICLMIAGLYVISCKNTGVPKKVTAYYQGLKSEQAVNATGSVIDVTTSPATGGVIIVPTIKPDNNVEPTAEPSQTPGVKKNGFVTTAKGKYYYKNGAALKEKWLTVNQKTYYFRKNGTAATGVYKINGVI